MEKYLTKKDEFLSGIISNKIISAMKITCTLIFTCLINISASVYSQNAKLNIDVQEATIRDVFKLIEGQSEFRFFYNEDFTDLDKRISYNSNNANVEEILKVILEKSDVFYKVLDNNLIVIAPSAELKRQGIPITGTITDAFGDPLPGVNVVVKGTSIGVVTDLNGRYSITVPNRDAILQFSFVGYVTQEVVIGAQNAININLSEDTKAIEEVVVVGYGTQKKSDLTGAITDRKSVV